MRAYRQNASDMWTPSNFFVLQVLLFLLFFYLSFYPRLSPHTFSLFLSLLPLCSVVYMFFFIRTRNMKLSLAVFRLKYSYFIPFLFVKLLFKTTAFIVKTTLNTCILEKHIRKYIRNQFIQNILYFYSDLFFISFDFWKNSSNLKKIW